MRVRVAPVFLACLVLSACASHPKTSAITDFSDAVNKSSTLLQSAVKLDATLDQKLGYEASVTSYMLRQPGFVFPPPRDAPSLHKEHIAARAGMLKAIADYATALGELNDPQHAAKVGDAVAKLGSSVTTYIRTTDPQVRTERWGPSAAILSSSAAFLVSQRNALVIQESTNSAHPSIARAAELLTQDFEVLNGRYGRKLARLRARQKFKLTKIHEDRSIDRIRLEQRFYEQYGSDQELAAQITALEQSRNILAALVKAHDDLRSADDNDRAVAEFKTFVDAITLNLTELKKL